MLVRPSRRRFLQLSAAAALAVPAGCLASGARPRVAGRQRHAGIGVGGMGAVDLEQISGHPNVDVVALCDVDQTLLQAAAEKHPGAALYRDWRELLSAERDHLDSVHVSTPDHMHAPITALALQAGLHVYCQKPLTHDVSEARRVAKLADSAGVVTQMGIQNRAALPYRSAFAILRGGAIGRVRDVHVWTDRPAGWWPQDVPRAEGADPVPDTLDWDLWLGTAPERPYRSGEYHPFAWRGRLDFGTGAQGDMACHLMDPALWFLELGAPATLRSIGPPPNAESYPAWSTVHYTFPATRFTVEEGVRVSWYDGARKPDEVLARYGATEVYANACLFEGQHGALLASPYEPPRLLPEANFSEVPDFELAPINHWHQWVDACAGAGKASAPFGYAGLLTEVALLGNVALRFPGEELRWDARRMRFPDQPAAEAFLGRRYRAPWSLSGLGTGRRRPSRTRGRSGRPRARAPARQALSCCPMGKTKLFALRRADYRPPDHWIDAVELDFDLRAEETVVRAHLKVRRNADANPDGRPLVLHGVELETRRVAVDGRTLEQGGYRIEEDTLVLEGLPDACTVSTEVVLHPELNTRLSGLYRSGKNFYTDLEPEGFRRLTWFLDRPDVMARYTTRIEAYKKLAPIMLSNGNRREAGDLPGGRHFVRWEDPFPKPSYLFALVAGELRAHRGTFRTLSGRDVALEVWTEPENVEKCAHALRSLQRAMRWDEERFGREYDLDIYMIVAVGDFNGGAMENKGLNVFNSKYVLAEPQAATDDDYEAIEGVIAHEYFHNWTGNRVTLRDWFQLTLKEGLTVYRDQEFTADMTSAPVKRIADVRTLRERQFPQDAGPMAHPIRPEEVVEMGNFYTSTVYEKGAEVIRMYATLFGRDGFRSGMDLYFERHDGGAVTCDDFRDALAAANDADLTRFGRWYSQSGTPLVTARGRYDAAARTYSLTLTQALPAGKLDPGPLPIPVRLGLLGRDGRDLPLRLEGERPERGGETTRVVVLEQREQTFRFTGVAAEPVPSLFRGFSAPVRCELARSRADLAFLLAHDSDAFQRWDAGQELALGVLLDLVREHAAGRPLALEPLLGEALGSVLADESLDGSLRALTLRLPEESVIAQSLFDVEPDGIHAARLFAVQQLARDLRGQLMDTYARLARAGAYSNDKASIDRRRLKNRVLGYLTALGEPDTTELARRQLEGADNMTDAFAALACLVEAPGEAREAALSAFHARWRSDPLVLDKWFAVQAASGAEDTFERVVALTQHADFTLRNPNRMRALLSTFSQMNQVRFHRADGAGYELLADKILDVDALNPKTAARLSTAFLTWRQMEPGRRARLQSVLKRIVDHPGLSKDVAEVAGKALEG
jgi:aminopeptidase N